MIYIVVGGRGAARPKVARPLIKARVKQVNGLAEWQQRLAPTSFV